MRVTEVLQLAGLRDGLQFVKDKDWYLQRGSHIHKAIALMDEGKLDDASLDARIRPYVNAAIKFRADFGGDLVAHEEEVIDTSEHVVGHYDAIYKGLRFQGHKKTSLTLVDWKTNGVDEATSIQTWKYARMWEGMHRPRKIPFRCGVALLETGDYKLIWYTSNDDLLDGEAWKAALKVAEGMQGLKRWKRAHGIETEQQNKE